jgi:hypothetical protein
MLWLCCTRIHCDQLLCVVTCLQTTARRSSIPIDSLIFEHGVVNLDEREINGPPKEGVYVKGLFLEGKRAVPRLRQFPGSVNLCSVLQPAEHRQLCSIQRVIFAMGD